MVFFEFPAASLVFVKVVWFWGPLVLCRGPSSGVSTSYLSTGLVRASPFGWVCCFDGVGGLIRSVEFLEGDKARSQGPGMDSFCCGEGSWCSLSSPQSLSAHKGGSVLVPSGPMWGTVLWGVHVLSLHPMVW